MYYDNDKTNTTLIECIHITQGTVESLTDLDRESNTIELVKYFENLFPDSSIFVDTNIHQLFGYLYESDFNDHQITLMNDRQYGNYIDFYYFKDLDIYIMDFGTR